MNTETLSLAVQLRRQLHTHPELSCQEVWTRQRLMDFLRQHTRLEIVDRGRWFYAVYRAASPGGIAFRADFDAVPVTETLDIPWKSQNPGVAHKCGHDGHSATLAAFALEVDRLGAGRTIFFLFQHAEETGQGAAECQSFIKEEGVEEIFAYHNIPGIPHGTVAVRTGITQCASKGISLYFTGLPAHASQPELGRNPAFAISQLVQAVPGLIACESWQDMVLCTVVHVSVGEAAFGVSPAQGVVRLTCRAVLERELDSLTQQLCALAGQLAERDGLTLRAEIQDSFPETIAHGCSVGKIDAACRQLGIPVLELPAPNRASEDFGYYTKRIPGAMFFMGAGDGPPVHTGEYDFDDRLIEPVVRVFKRLAGIEG